MAESVGRRPDSEVPDIDDGLWERIRDAVLAESGAAKSLWNGHLGYTDPAEPVLGEAYGDARLKLSEAEVVRPLQEMFEKRGERVTQEQLIARRRAFEVVVHEFAHLAVPADYEIWDRLDDIGRQELIPIEEGSNEAWSQAKMDALIDRVLPRDLAVQLRAVDSPRLYPGWDPAARAFADDVGAETGIDGDEVLDLMAREARSGKARAVAELLFENSELPSLVPPDQQAGVRRQLREQIDTAFADLRPLGEDSRVNLRSISTQRGQVIAESVVRGMRATEKQFRSDPVRLAQEAARQAQERSSPAEDLSALPPPNPDDQRPGPEQAAAPVDPRIADAQQQAPVAGAEVEGLRKLMGEQAPAAGAVRVPQGQAVGGRADATGRVAGPAAGRSTETAER
ncbi:hypothetical protein [Kribbella catacumbae]|uniref:hypothetical protein n=1 Tax=Kribbella catacumbae TaxID=460086 RepID=UPI000372E284|nr:hypothetical protein [Kribbella catacumbae]